MTAAVCYIFVLLKMYTIATFIITFIYFKKMP